VRPISRSRTRMSGDVFWIDTCIRTVKRTAVVMPGLFSQRGSLPQVSTAVTSRQSEKGAATMPEKKTVEKAKRDLREGKSPSTAAGEFVHEEIEHIRQGKHGARSAKQAIAIGLSKARRAGVPLEPPAKGTTSERTRRSASRALEAGQGTRKPRAKSGKRRAATSRALKREPKAAASTTALSRQAKSAAKRRTNTKKTSNATTRRTKANPARRAAPKTRKTTPRRTSRSTAAEPSTRE
jgi:hypothetical protein